MKAYLSMLVVVCAIATGACKQEMQNQEAVKGQESNTDSMQTVIDSVRNDDTGSMSFLSYDEPPVLLHSSPAVYPAEFRKTGIQGNVILNVEVLQDGSVGMVSVRNSLLKGVGALDDVAMNTVKQWKYQAALKDNQPVAANIIQIVEFKLK